jgi:hypothetical protein
MSTLFTTQKHIASSYITDWAGIATRTNCFTVIYKNPARTSQETHHVSATKPNRLMLFRQAENHAEHTDTLCGQNAEFSYVKDGL